MTLKKLLSQISKFSLATIISTLVSLIAIPLITHVVPTGEYGQVTMFVTLGTTIMSFCFLGMDNGYIRFFESYKETQKVKSIAIKAIWIGVAVITLAFAVCAAIGFDVVSERFFVEDNAMLIVLLYVYALALCIFRITNISARMGNHPRAYNYQNVGQTFISRILIVVIIIFTLDHNHIIALITVATILLSVICFLYAKKNFYTDHEAASGEDIKKLALFSLPLFPVAVLSNLNSSIAKLAFSGAGMIEELGVFSIGLSIANIVAIVPRCFGVYWAPFIYSNYEKEKDLICSMHDYVMLLSVIMLVGISSVQDLGYMLIGSEYAFSQSYFMLLMLIPLEQFIAETTSYGITIAKKTTISMVISIIVFGLTVGLCFWLTPIYGQIGAAASVCFAILIGLVLKTAFAQKYFKTIRSYGRTVTAMLAILGIVISNTFLYQSLLLRFAIHFATLAVILFIYRSVMVEAVRKFKNS